MFDRPILQRGIGVPPMFVILIFTCGLLLPGCTIHPAGEREERNAAIAAGQGYQRPAARSVELLPAHPTRDDLVRYALATNPDVEQRYWEWRSAIEQIPIDGTQPTNLAIFGSAGLTHGRAALSQTTISAGNDPMADIVLPNKLEAAAERSLATARAAGVRFHKAQLDLRAKVLSAYDDCVLAAELVRLGEQNTQLLRTIALVTEARNQSGSASQQDVLRAANEVDLSINDVANQQAQLPALRAQLNALLDRTPDATLDLQDPIPTLSFTRTDAEVLHSAAQSNPELAELTDEVHAREVGIRVAKLMYVPDFSLTGGSDLSGITQSLSAMLTVPLLKYEAIHAAIAQAQANLHAAQAMRRQTSNDLSAQLVMDLATLHDADRQLRLFDQTIRPRAQQVVEVSRTAYESASGSLLDLLSAQRSVNDIQRLVANLRSTRDKRVLEIQSLINDSN